MLTIERVPAKVVAVTPVSLKHGKKKRVPAQKITLEFLLPNITLKEIDSELLESFYKARTVAPANPKTKQTSADLSSSPLPDLKFPWMKDAIAVPTVLVGYTAIFHVGASEKSAITQNVEKGDNASVLMRDDGHYIFRIQILVRPPHKEKGQIEDMLQTDVTTSLLPAETPLTQETLFKSKVENGQIVDTDPLGVNSDEHPDAFAGTDVARDAQGGAE